MKYSNYKKEDFIVDEYFKSWVIHPTTESDFFWRSFLNNNPQKFNVILEAKEFILSLSFQQIEKESLKPEDVDAIFSNVLQHNNHSYLHKQNKVYWKPQISTGVIVRIAAILLIFSIFGISWFFSTPSHNERHQTVTSIITKKTAKGEKLTLRLPDKSVVILNSESSLEYPATFSKDHRTLKLHGEAYFEVVKDNDRPFIVQSDEFSTEVKGTSFAIKKHKDNSTIRVSVVSGLVEVFCHTEIGDTEKIEVEAQQMASFNNAKQVFEKKALDFNNMVAWKDGILYFSNVDLNEIVEKIENWYGVNITITKSLDRKHDFSGQFENESLDLVLEGIGFVYDFDYIINGKEVIIQ